MSTKTASIIHFLVSDRNVYYCMYASSADNLIVLRSIFTDWKTHNESQLSHSLPTDRTGGIKLHNYL